MIYRNRQPFSTRDDVYEDSLIKLKGTLFVELQLTFLTNTGELGYDRLNGTRKIGPSYAKSVVYI